MWTNLLDDIDDIIVNSVRCDNGLVIMQEDDLILWKCRFAYLEEKYYVSVVPLK